MPVGLPPPRTPAPPRPSGDLPPQFHTPRGRRTLALFGAGALVLVLGFLAFTAVEFFFLMRGGSNTVVSTTIPADLPAQVPFCTAFKASRSFSTPVEGGRHFLVQGDCPENRLQLEDDLIGLMKDNGWTVHDDGQGSLTSYSYDRHQRLDIGINDSNSPANQAAVTVEVWTGLTHPPDGFPRPSVSPSPR
ncbi:MAG: hypothetical protein ABR573_03255 [Candidatus Dormibacteria bacterium]